MSRRADDYAAVFETPKGSRARRARVAREESLADMPRELGTDGLIVEERCAECQNPRGTYHWPDCGWWDRHPDVVPF